ncbi:hypothetical protein STEG23_024190 [Scotinomys teguina]
MFCGLPELKPTLPIPHLSVFPSSAPGSTASGSAGQVGGGALRRPLCEPVREPPLLAGPRRAAQGRVEPEDPPGQASIGSQRLSEELAPASRPPRPPAAKMSASNVSLLHETSRQVVAGGAAGKAAGSPLASRSSTVPPRNVPKPGLITKFCGRPPKSSVQLAKSRGGKQPVVAAKSSLGHSPRSAPGFLRFSVSKKCRQVSEIYWNFEEAS